jgi:hypothetical protein
MPSEFRSRFEKREQPTTPAASAETVKPEDDTDEWKANTQILLKLAEAS